VSRSPELLAQASALVAQRLCPQSLSHCERVAETASGLARRFGVDESRAELAGLLHDVARDEADERLLFLAAELDCPILEFEREHPYLLHARVGAALARRAIPDLGEAVISAIEVHTVGALPMSDLDRVVYLADMIEPARAFEGVGELRDACARLPLPECFRLGYGRAVRHILAKGRPVHPISVAVGAQIERETGRALFDPPAVAS